MPESSPPGAPTGSTGAIPRVSGEIVHEQTVRAVIPVAPTTETTVRAPMPSPAPLEQTVRAFVPSAVPATAGAGEPVVEPVEVEELEELDVEPVAEASATGPGPQLDVSALVSELEAQARRRTAEADAPVSQADRITVPEAAAKAFGAAGDELSGPPRKAVGAAGDELSGPPRKAVGAAGDEPAKKVPTAEAPAPGARPRRKRPHDEGGPKRPAPPPVSGEVSVAEPEPDDLFDSSVPRRGERVRAADRAPVAKVRRGDPPTVSGEVAIDPAKTQTPEVPAADVRVMPMTSSGSHPVMTASGSHPVMTASGPQPVMHSSGSHPILLGSGPQPVMPSSGSHPILTISGGSPVVPRRAGTDPGFGGRETTGPQPRTQAEPTGPHPVMRPRRSDRPTDNLVLWALAGTLVVLAIGVVMLVVSWTQ